MNAMSFYVFFFVLAVLAVKIYVQENQKKLELFVKLLLKIIILFTIFFLVFKFFCDFDLPLFPYGVERDMNDTARNIIKVYILIITIPTIIMVFVIIYLLPLFIMCNIIFKDNILIFHVQFLSEFEDMNTGMVRFIYFIVFVLVIVIMTLMSCHFLYYV